MLGTSLFGTLTVLVLIISIIIVFNVEKVFKVKQNLPAHLGLVSTPLTTFPICTVLNRSQTIATQSTWLAGSVHLEQKDIKI